MNFVVGWGKWRGGFINPVRLLRAERLKIEDVINLEVSYLWSSGDVLPECSTIPPVSCSDELCILYVSLPQNTSCNKNRKDEEDFGRRRCRA